MYNISQEWLKQIIFACLFIHLSLLYYTLEETLWLKRGTFMDAVCFFKWKLYGHVYVDFLLLSLYADVVCGA